MKKQDYKAQLKQGGIIVASVEGSDKEAVEKEIQHYALMYSQDGEISIKRNYKQTKEQEISIEVRNETGREVYVKLCRGMFGNLYLHIDNKKSKHINIPVKAHYYEIVKSEGVDF